MNYREACYALGRAKALLQEISTVIKPLSERKQLLFNRSIAELEKKLPIIIEYGSQTLIEEGIQAIIDHFHAMSADKLEIKNLYRQWHQTAIHLCITHHRMISETLLTLQPSLISTEERLGAAPAA